MTVPNQPTANTATPPKERPEALALRARPRPVTRLNRKVLIILATTLSGALIVATAWSLKPHLRDAATQPPPNTDHVKKPEGFDGLPKDYSEVKGVPQLGAPMGELGRPVLHAEQAAGIELPPPEANFKPNAEDNAYRSAQLQEVQEIKRAQTSKVFFQLSERPKQDDGIGPAKETTQGPSSSAPGATATREPPTQPPPEKPTLLAGTLIAASLLTGINSDLPGQILANVTENVFDTVTGSVLLIPQGSRLIGKYDSQVAYGQRRVMLIWTRLIRPDGSSVALGDLPGVDAAGAAGLEDRVDWHWGQLIKGAALSTLIGVGAELASPERNDGEGRVIIAGRQSVEETVNQVGQQITRKNLDVKPTLTIRPGFPVRVIVGKDLAIAPYGTPTEFPP